MEGKWAYIQDPTKQVRILCVDRPRGSPVVSMSDSGTLMWHSANGSTLSGKHNLVPLEEPVWSF
jgi:hypothetical protein